MADRPPPHGDCENTYPLIGMGGTNGNLHGPNTATVEQAQYSTVKQGNKCVNPVVVFMVVSLMCLGLSMASFYIYFTQNKAPQSYNICVTCKELFSKPVENEFLQFMKSRSERANQLECCAENNDELAAMLEYLLPDQGVRGHIEKDPISMGLSSEPNNVQKRFRSQVGAHKQLIYEPKFARKTVPDFSGSFPLIIRNKTSKYGFEYSNQVDLLQKGIRVRHAGLYYVYMSIYFNTLGNCRHYEQQTFTAYLYRDNSQTYSHPNGDELLKTENTCCTTCVRNSDSSYVGGVFRLDEGDVIHVTVSAFGVVYITNDITFMGLSLMGYPKPGYEEGGAPAS